MHTEYKYSYQDGEGQIIATLDVIPKADSAENTTLWVTNLWVHPDHRGHHYASRMLNRVVQEWGHRDMYLQVQPYADKPRGVLGLQVIYERYGFEKTEFPTLMKRPAKTGAQGE